MCDSCYIILWDNVNIRVYKGIYLMCKKFFFFYIISRLVLGGK